MTPRAQLSRGARGASPTEPVDLSIDPEARPADDSRTSASSPLFCDTSPVSRTCRFEAGSPGPRGTSWRGSRSVAPFPDPSPGRRRRRRLEKTIAELDSRDRRSRRRSSVTPPSWSAPRLRSWRRPAGALTSSSSGASALAPRARRDPVRRRGLTRADGARSENLLCLIDLGSSNDLAREVIELYFQEDQDVPPPSSSRSGSRMPGAGPAGGSLPPGGASTSRSPSGCGPGPLSVCRSRSRAGAARHPRRPRACARS